MSETMDKCVKLAKEIASHSIKKSSKLSISYKMSSSIKKSFINNDKKLVHEIRLYS